MKNSILNDLKRLFLVIAGGLVLAIDFNVFVYSVSLFPGGFSGLAVLIQVVFQKYFSIDIPFSVLVYAFNAVPVVVGFKFIGKKFTIFSVIMIVVSGFFTDLLRGVEALHVTQDILLCSVFGGMLCAVSVCLCLFAESSSGGTDFIAIYVSERTGKSAWNWILAFNTLILLTAGFLVGWDKALYSIIFQYVSTVTINLLYKKYSKTTLLIITDKPDEIFEVILFLTNHTATVFEGKGGFSGNKHYLLYCVVSSSESGSLERAIRVKDQNAFINVIKSKEIVGRFFRTMPD